MSNKLNERLVIETYIAYKLCSKNIIFIGQEGDGGLVDLIKKTVGRNRSKDASDKYIRRCKSDLRNVGAMAKKSRVQRIVDRTETAYCPNWENDFQQPDNIRYQGTGRYNNTTVHKNINSPHLSPVDYTFTLKDYKAIKADSPAELENLRSLYRIVLTINSEYFDDYDKLNNHVNKFLSEYLDTFEADENYVDEFFNTINYIRQAIILDENYNHEKYDSLFERDSVDDESTKEEKMESLSDLLTAFKYGTRECRYGFKPVPIELTEDDLLDGRRRETGHNNHRKKNKSQNKS